MTVPTPRSPRPVAMVLGGSRGLGLLLARELGTRGYDLAVVARSPDGLDAARSDLEATGATVVTLPADLSSRAEAEACVDAVARTFSRLDVVVANAGIIQVAPLRSITATEVVEAHDAIFWSAVFPVLHAVEVMRRLHGEGRQGPGRVAVITSIGGKVPTPHLLPYTAAKFATVGFAESLRTEVAKDGISVTTVVPGLLRTGSPRNAHVGGAAEAEYRWFTVLDSIPVLAMDAERAARRIVSATLARRGEVVLTPLAKIGLRVHGLAPAVTTAALALVDRVLPDPGADGDRPAPAHELREQPRWFRLLTTLTGRAADRHREYDDETPGSRTGR